jgi:hypothetical protein
VDTGANLDLSSVFTTVLSASLVAVVLDDDDCKDPSYCKDPPYTTLTFSCEALNTFVRFNEEGMCDNHLIITMNNASIRDMFIVFIIL